MIQKSNLEEISQNININTEIDKQDEINKSQISLPQDSISKTKSKVSENISDSMSKDNDIIESFKDDISDSFIKLKEDEEYVGSDEYIEKEASEKLGLTHDNWIIFKEKEN